MGRIVCWTIFGLSLAGIACWGQEVLPVWRTNFAAYLTNRPWVAEVEFDLSRNRYNSNGKPHEGIATLRGSLQPGGFFLQFVTNWVSPNLLVAGESTDAYWETAINGPVFASKRTEEGGSSSNSLETLCSLHKQTLLDVLNLGIERLDADNIEWSSPDQFTGGLLTYDGHPTYDKIKVTIEAFDQGLPSRLRYANTQKTNEERLVLYRYSQHSLPPPEAIIQKVVNGKPMDPWTNTIRHINFGLREDAKQGFLPSAFLASNYVPPLIIIQSNGLRYSIQADGSLKLWEPSAYKEYQALMKPRHSHWIVFICILIGITIAFTFLVRKRGGTD